MRLSKKNSQIIGVLVVVLFFVIAHLTSRSTTVPVNMPDSSNRLEIPAPSANKSQDTEEQPSEEQPLSQFELSEFKRSSVKDGVKLWEVIAERGTYDPKTNLAQLFSSTIEILQNEGDSLHIKSDKATIDLKDNSLDKALISGNVIVKLDSDTTLYTETAEYLNQEAKIQTLAPIRIVNSMLEITGQSLIADTEEQIATISGKVKTIIFSGSERKKTKE